MAKLLKEANADTKALVASILEEEYPAIAHMEPHLEIGVLMASSDEAGQPALSKGGYPCAGLIRVVSEEDRAAGGPDIIIILDGDRWPEWDDTERYSMVHHELHHIVPAKLRPRLDVPAGYFCDVDSLGRPKIRLRKHDFEIGGFNLIVERHGDASIEWQSVVRVHDAFNQQVFTFAKASGKSAASKQA